MANETRTAPGAAARGISYFVDAAGNRFAVFLIETVLTDDEGDRTEPREVKVWLQANPPPPPGYLPVGTLVGAGKAFANAGEAQSFLDSLVAQYQSVKTAKNW